MKKSITVSALALAVVCTLSVASFVKAATTVTLGAADNFAVLANSGVTATTPSVVGGDVGLSPSAGTLYTGLTTPMVSGIIYAVDATGPAGASGNNPALLTSATGALTSAFTAAGQTPTGTITADMGGSTLFPGVYKDNGAPNSLSLTGTLTLDAQGDPNAVFILQSGSTLTTGSNSHVTLINGAQACNVFWQVGSSATLGTGSDFKGTILAAASITDNGGSTVEGRFLAKTGAVTLNNTHITKATCVGLPPSGGSTGMRYFERLPAINVTKIPTPSSLPAGPGAVRYDYAVTNIGQVPMTTVWVKDDKCSPATFVSGDTNGNNLLDLTETWRFSCSKTVSQTETNTATAHGYGVGLGLDVYDTANATVVVGSSIAPPLIHLVKTAKPTVLPAAGGHVVYSYAVTNPGTVALSDVSIADDKCALPGRVVGHPGDTNKNNLLDPGETFVFTCASNLTRTTTNIGTAEGHANGLTAIDISPATVVVNPPTMPDTGFPPRDASNGWNLFALIGGAAGSIAAVLFLRRRA